MLKNFATDHMHSMSCEEIRDIEGRSKISTIYKHIRKLEGLGLVTKGAKIERAYGYILTNKANIYQWMELHLSTEHKN